MARMVEGVWFCNCSLKDAEGHIVVKSKDGAGVSVS
jgi:hypothetical protein